VSVYSSLPIDMSSPPPPAAIFSSSPKPRLDLLPPEILRDILDCFAPFLRAFHQYKARQTILLSLCSTSKRLLPFAQPTLFEAIVLNSEAAVAQVANKSDLLSHCRWMRLNLSTTDFSRNSKLEMDFRVILESATRLNDLSYYGSLRPSTVHIASSESLLFLSRSDGFLTDSFVFNSQTLRNYTFPPSSSVQHSHFPSRILKNSASTESLH